VGFEKPREVGGGAARRRARELGMGEAASTNGGLAPLSKRRSGAARTVFVTADEPWALLVQHISPAP
jgi:hypothetical protein